MVKLMFFCAMLTILNLKQVSTQTTGDVRLVGQNKPNLGRLEIYWKDRWSTFCGANKNSFTMGAAQAACRQLGYLDAFRFDTVSKFNFSRATEDTPIAFGMVDCEYKFALGALHILRCTTSEQVPTECSHDDDIGLACEPVSLWQHPYNTQVRLSPITTPSYTSAGKLDIFITDKWGSVCFTEGEFDQHAADSACRQMGYTNAGSYKGVSSSDQITWLKKVTCGVESQKCIRWCPGFKLPNSPTSCTPKMYAYIQCTFDKSQSHYSAGSQDVCSKESQTSNSAGIVTAIVIIVLLSAAIVVLLILVCVCCLVPSCYLYQWRKRKLSGYSSDL